MTSDPQGEAALAELHHIYYRRTQLDLEELGAIFRARQAQLSWRTIAPTVGLGSAQAAQYRYQALIRRHPNTLPPDTTTEGASDGGTVPHG